MVGAEGASTRTENADAGGESAKVDATGEKELADLAEYVIIDIFRMMDGLYVDHEHQNDGTYLTGGIADDAEWRAHFNRAIVLNNQYDLPWGIPSALNFKHY